MILLSKINNFQFLKFNFLFFLISFLSSFFVFSNGGVGYKGIKVNLNGTNNWYNVHGVTWSYQGCGDYGNTFYNNGIENWNSVNLGTFSTTASLQITGYAVVGWSNSGDYIAGKLEYKVWKQTDTEPESWSVINIGNYENPTLGATQTVCSSGDDKVVGFNNSTISFQPGTAGTYNFKVKGYGRVQYSGGGGGFFNVNDGSDLIATFTISEAIPTISSTASSITSNNSQTYKGSTITINGTNLGSINTVKIGGINGVTCFNVTVVNSNETTAVVPDGSSGGTIWISDGTYSANSEDNYNNLGFISTGSGGNWNVGASWLGGTAPSESTSRVTIASGAPISLSTDISITNLTINNGGIFTASDSTPRTLTISNGGFLTNNGTFTAGNGTVAFSGSATVSGTITFNNATLAGGVDFGTGSTIGGTLTVNPSGFVSANAPTYNSSATLRYNTSGTYDRGTEWSATSGRGYPHHVQISGNTTLNVHNNQDTQRQIAGNLTIDSGSTFTTGAMNVPDQPIGVIILGNIINNGTFTLATSADRVRCVNFTNNANASTTLSTNNGGDLELTGNFIDNAPFDSNNRAVFFTGSGVQEVSGSGTFDIDYIVSNKPSGSIRMLANLLVEGPNGGNAITLTNASDILDLNGNTLTLGKANVASIFTGN